MITKTKILILGSTDLTKAIMIHLIKNNINIVGVSSTKKRFEISYVKDKMLNSRFVDIQEICQKYNLEHYEYSNIKGLITFIKKIQPNIIIAIGWFHFISKQILKIPNLICIGLHASLLPKYRGGAPLNWAILNNENETGASLFYIDEGIDDGDLIEQKKIPILKSDYIGDLLQKIEHVSIEMIKNFIESFESGITPRIRQDGTPSYSLQRFPENGKINWNLKNSKIFDLIKAVSFPYPGAYTYLDNKKIIIWRANINDKICVYGSCGQIFYNSKINKVFVICSSGILSIEKTTFDDGSNALDYLKKKNNQFFDEYFNG